MPALCSLSDCELVARLPTLVQAERHAVAAVIEHLVEMERRRLYLRLSVSSLYRYCIEPPTLENLCLLCTAHNLENARQVFGEPHIETKIRPKMRAGGGGATQTQPVEPQPLETPAKVFSSLASLGFARKEASAAVGQALGSEPGLDVEQLLRRCLLLLTLKQADSERALTLERRRFAGQRPSDANATIGSMLAFAGRNWWGCSDNGDVS